MFGLIKKMFFILLTNIVSASNHTKYVSLSSEKCMTQPTLIKFFPNEYCQEFRYYLFMVNVNRCTGSCNTRDDLFQ